MKLVVQRVSQASVMVDGELISEIGSGLLVFLGIAETDTKAHADKLIAKLSKLRVFADENGKTNLSVGDIGGGILVISQFTLYADCTKGNRPSFIGAARPELAEELYEYFIRSCDGKFAEVCRGIFGADMKVSLVNDGPFTIILEY